MFGELVEVGGYEYMFVDVKNGFGLNYWILVVMVDVIWDGILVIMFYFEWCWYLVE